MPDIDAMAEPRWAEIGPPRRSASRGSRRSSRGLVIALVVLAVVVVGVLVLRAVRSGPPVALEEAFGDDGLRACVARALGVDVDDTVTEDDLEGIDRLECALSNLDGDGPDRAPIRHLEGIESLVGLEQINLGWQPHVTDLRPLATLPRLASLNLLYVPITDLTGIESMTALTTLELGQDGCFTRSGETRLSDISPLAGAERLESVNLTCTDVSDLAPLAGLSALTSLALAGTPVRDVGPLAGLPALRTLSLGFTPVEDVSPLADLVTLRSLDLIGADVLDVSSLDGLPDVEITR
ncbi:hypothetical protein [Sanguibacter sp. 25GB23B1]|uniref:leucine-rich repeat domain-containing protein n=1 Tax=unclassified Sanguibacter TaxID=2645534 RepID=UPI0032AE93F2